MSILFKPSSVTHDKESTVHPAAADKRLQYWLGCVLREPFFQFMALGFVVWLGTHYVESLNRRYTIHIGEAERKRLALTYQQQFSQAPTANQLETIIQRYVMEEIYLREGLALDLDKDDEIVRRRIAQKFEFLQTDLAMPEAPAPRALEEWYDQNKVHYTTPMQVAFTQIYFSADRDGDTAAQARAASILRSLNQKHIARAPTLGDSFPGPTDVGILAPDAAERLFGKSQFSEELFKIPVGQWAGPFHSGYGWHLVYVTERKLPELPRLDDVRAKVLADYTDAQRRILNAGRFNKLRSKYTIVQDGAGS